MRILTLHLYSPIPYYRVPLEEVSLFAPMPAVRQAISYAEQHIIDYQLAEAAISCRFNPDDGTPLPGSEHLAVSLLPASPDLYGSILEYNDKFFPVGDYLFMQFSDNSPEGIYAACSLFTEHLLQRDTALFTEIITLRMVREQPGALSGVPEEFAFQFCCRKRDS